MQTGGIWYHGGPILEQTKVVAIYWAATPIYANGPTPGTTGSGAQDGSLIGYFLNHLGGSNYFGINTTYYDAVHPVQNVVTYTGFWANNQNVPASNGSEVSDGTIRAMITSGLQSGSLAYDPQTVYVVFGAGRTNLGGGFTGANGYCGYHGNFQPSGFPTVTYAVLPYDAYYYSICTNGTPYPNGDPADAEVNTLAHEVEEVTTDFLLNAWFGSDTKHENADLCAWNFGQGAGATYSNGTGTANIRLGSRDFLVQTNWANRDDGGCFFGLNHAGLYVTALSGVPQPVRIPGSYTAAIGGTSVSPRGSTWYKWEVSYSNGVLPPVITPYQGSSYSLNVPAGSYTIYVTVTPRDYEGVGYPTAWTYSVCTAEGAAAKSISPDAVGGCAPPPDPLAATR
jgi:hypothetical protein